MRSSSFLRSAMPRSGARPRGTHVKLPSVPINFQYWSSVTPNSSSHSERGSDGGPTRYLREVLDEVQSVPRHAQQLFFALGDAQVRRATARHPREIAKRADQFPVLVLRDAQLVE